MNVRKLYPTLVFHALVAVTALLVGFGVGACSPRETPPAPMGPSTIVMPNLEGKCWAATQRELNSQGWTGMLDKGPDIPVGPQNHNRVMRQNPAPGEHVNSDTRIAVQFGK